MNTDETVSIEIRKGKHIGPRILTIDFWAGKGFYSPKEDLLELLKEDECAKPGVYCLKYLVREKCREEVYIGEADNIRDRLLTHFRNPQKNSFIEVMFFISISDYLTKTQVKYLEHRLIEEAVAINAPIQNLQIPSQPSIQSKDRNVLEKFLDKIQLMLSLMGFNFMNPAYYPGTPAEIDMNIDTPGKLYHPPLPPRFFPIRSAEPMVLNEKQGLFSNNQTESSTITDQQPEKENIEKPTVQESIKIDTNEPETPEFPKIEIPQIPLDSPKDVKEIEGKIDIPETFPETGTKTRTPIKDIKTDFPSPVGKYKIVDKELNARMDVDGDKFIVRKGSQARKDISKSISGNYIALRNQLIKQRILVDDGQYLRFTVDYPFTSSSAASNTVVGRQSPGPRMWVDEDNRSLRGFINDSRS